MRPDPIEITTARPTKRIRSGIATRVSVASNATTQQPAAVVDEAFAEYAHAVTRNLVADIAAQLRTLDKQREQLARLLDSAEIGAATK